MKSRARENEKVARRSGRGAADEGGKRKKKKKNEKRLAEGTLLCSKILSSRERVLCSLFSVLSSLPSTTMLTALGRRGSRGALAALARAARGGEVRFPSIVNQKKAIDDDGVPFFCLGRKPLAPFSWPLFPAAMYREDETMRVSAARVDQTRGQKRGWNFCDGKRDEGEQIDGRRERERKCLALISQVLLFAGLSLPCPASSGSW